jgi:hypothetical protein
MGIEAQEQAAPGFSQSVAQSGYGSVSQSFTPA